MTLPSRNFSRPASERSQTDVPSSIPQGRSEEGRAEGMVDNRRVVQLDVAAGGERGEGRIGGEGEAVGVALELLAPAPRIDGRYVGSAVGVRDEKVVDPSTRCAST